MYAPFGRKPSEHEPASSRSSSPTRERVMLSRKGLINRYTRKEGVQVNQPDPTEMRGAMQWGLPGGASLPLESYGVSGPVPDEGPAGAQVALRRLARDSGADELLAETGVNVRSKAFLPRSTTYANDKGSEAGDGERTHAAFQYQGKISELVQQANALVALNGTADNETSQLAAVPLSVAFKIMQGSFDQAQSSSFDEGLP